MSNELIKALAEHVLAPTSRQRAIARERVRQELAKAQEPQKDAWQAYVAAYATLQQSVETPAPAKSMPKWLAEGGDA